jgi:alpha-galactosidase
VNIRLTLFLLLALPTFQTASAQQQTSIIKKDSTWMIKTHTSAYQLILDRKGKVIPVFYGDAAQAGFGKRNVQWVTAVQEVPARGGFPFTTPILEVIFDDKVRDADLVYSSDAITLVNGQPTLAITFKDKYYPLEVTSYIRALPEYDLLEKWITAKNTGKKGTIRIENLQSASLTLPANDYKLHHLAGKQEHEFQLQETVLTPGLKVIQNKGFKSNSQAPWFLVQPANAAGENGPTWFGSLHYSGNWQLSFDQTFEGPLQITGGINFWDASWDLQPDSSFTTPKLTIGYTSKGAEEASRLLTAYVRNTILPAKHRDLLRPVIYNSWFSTFYAVNEEQQLKLANVAKEIGIEMFVIDDGWFKNRTTHTKGLGDWEVDKQKFPNGLAPLIKKINDMGMQFGIWVEPESVVTEAELYKQHPDWVLQFPHRENTSYRLFLNLAREDVYQYLLNRLTALLRDHNIKFVKWDQNSYLSYPGWPGATEAQQRAVRMLFINNLYRLVETLRGRFPDVWFESCASGAGRIDLGMMSRMDQAWVSDNVDALDRIYIQYGYLSALPANTMVSWVSGVTKHQPLDLSFKFDASMSGVLGVGDNISKWTEADIAVAKKKIQEYKIIRPLVQQGTVYRLVSPFVTNQCALEFTSADKDSAAVICYNLGESLPGSTPSREQSVLKLQGLDANKQYKIRMPGKEAAGIEIYSGALLMNVGIAWPLKGANKSGVLIVSAVSK